MLIHRLPTVLTWNPAPTSAPTNAVNRHLPAMLLAALTLFTGCSTHSPDASQFSAFDRRSAAPAAQAPPLSDKKAVEQWNEDMLQRLANKTLTVKQLEDILAQCDQYIAAYQERYGSASGVFYSARSESERAAYLALSGKEAGKVQITVLDATWSGALFLRGYVLIELKRYDEALPSLEKALALGPFNAKYLIELGYLKQHQQWFVASLYYYRAAKEVALVHSPEHLKRLETARAIRGIGSVFIDIGKWDAARQQFIESLVFEPDNETAKNELRYMAEMKTPENAFRMRLPAPQGAAVR